jgi:hypothetical protein
LVVVKVALLVEGGEDKQTSMWKFMVWMTRFFFSSAVIRRLSEVELVNLGEKNL